MESYCNMQSIKRTHVAALQALATVLDEGPSVAVSVWKGRSRTVLRRPCAACGSRNHRTSC
jgi:hypothetical protein